MYSKKKEQSREVLNAFGAALMMGVILIISLFAIVKFIYNLI